MLDNNLKNSINDLSKTSTLLLSDLREEIFFARLSKFLFESLNGDQVEVCIAYNDESTRLVARNGESLDNEAILERGVGVSGYVARSKRIYYSNSVKRDPVFSGLRAASDINSELVVPMVVEGQVLATIHLQSKLEDRNFNEQDAVIVKEFLNENNIAITNMNLYLMAKNLNRELMKKNSTATIDTDGVGFSVSASNEKVEILGQDAKLLQALALAKKIARQDVPAFIAGESGVGKRLLARKIHSMSDRKDRVCRVVECRVVNEKSLELELFGNEELAGALEQANGGTVILNEIAHLSLGFQSKVLDFLTNGKMRRVGTDKDLNLNVRIIVTSKVNLSELVANKKFREDLYYRLSTIQITLPSLKDRQEDVKILANHFLNQGKSEKRYLTNNALDLLMSHSWKGNILELKNTMERTYALSDGKYIEEIHFNMGEINGEQNEADNQGANNSSAEFEAITLQEVERIHICRTLEKLSGNKTRAAQSLGITVKTLYNKLHSYNLINSSKN